MCLQDLRRGSYRPLVSFWQTQATTRLSRPSGRSCMEAAVPRTAPSPPHTRAPCESPCGCPSLCLRSLMGNPVTLHFPSSSVSSSL